MKSPSPPDHALSRSKACDWAEEVGALKRELSMLVGGEDRLTFDILNGKSPEAALEKVTMGYE